VTTRFKYWGFNDRHESVSIIAFCHLCSFVKYEDVASQGWVQK